MHSSIVHIIKNEKKNHLQWLSLPINSPIILSLALIFRAFIHRCCDFVYGSVRFYFISFDRIQSDYFSVALNYVAIAIITYTVYCSLRYAYATHPSTDKAKCMSTERVETTTTT